MKTGNLLDLLKRKFYFLDLVLISENRFTLKGGFITNIELDVYLELDYDGKCLHIKIYDDYLSNNLGYILNENITEQKLDEILSQINKINNSFYMIEKITEELK